MWVFRTSYSRIDLKSSILASEFGCRHIWNRNKITHPRIPNLYAKSKY